MDVAYLVFWFICIFLNARSMFETSEQRAAKKGKAANSLVNGCRALSMAGIPLGIVRGLFIIVLLVVMAQDVVGVVLVYALGLQHGIDCRPVLLFIIPSFLVMFIDGRDLMTFLRYMSNQEEDTAREVIMTAGTSQRRHLANHTLNATRMAICIIGLALVLNAGR